MNDITPTGPSDNPQQRSVESLLETLPEDIRTKVMTPYDCEPGTLFAPPQQPPTSEESVVIVNALLLIGGCAQSPLSEDADDMATRAIDQAANYGAQLAHAPVERVGELMLVLNGIISESSEKPRRMCAIRTLRALIESFQFEVGAASQDGEGFTTRRYDYLVEPARSVLVKNLLMRPPSNETHASYRTLDDAFDDAGVAIHALVKVLERDGASHMKAAIAQLDRTLQEAETCDSPRPIPVDVSEYALNTILIKVALEEKDNLRVGYVASMLRDQRFSPDEKIQSLFRLLLADPADPMMTFSPECSMRIAKMLDESCPTATCLIREIAALGAEPADVRNQLKDAVR